MKWMLKALILFNLASAAFAATISQVCDLSPGEYCIIEIADGATKTLKLVGYREHSAPYYLHRGIGEEDEDFARDRLRVFVDVDHVMFSSSMRVPDTSW